MRFTAYVLLFLGLFGFWGYSSPIRWISLAVALPFLVVLRTPKLNFDALGTQIGIATVSCFGLLIGAINGSDNKAIVDFAKLLILYPLAFLTLAAFVTFRNNKQYIRQAVALSLLLLSLLYLSIFFNKVLDVFSDDVFPLNAFHLDIAFGQGVVRASYDGLIGLFLLAVINLGYQIKRPTLLGYFALALSAGSIFISGRRALIIFMVLLVLFLLWNFRLRNAKKKILAIVLSPLLLLTYLNNIDQNVSLGSVNQYFSSEFTTEAVRYQQLVILAEQSVKNVFLPAGLGSEIPGYVRSEEAPWSYELTYIKLLYDLGLFGFILLVALYLCRVKKFLGHENKSDDFFIYGVLLPMSLASISITNPYMGNVESAFIMTLPFILKPPKRTN